MGENQTTGTGSGNAKAIIEAARTFGDAQLFNLDSGILREGDAAEPHAIVLPQGRELKSLKKIIDEFRDAPERRKGTAVLTTLASFIEHVKRNKSGDSAVFVESPGMLAASMTAIYDYHPANPSVTDAAFGQYRSRFNFPLSDEWNRWAAINGKWIAQESLAEFLEERAGDIIDPGSAQDGSREFAKSWGLRLAGQAEMIGLSRGLTIKVGQNVKQHRNLSSGEAQIVFEESHTDETGAALNVPGGFVLGIPVLLDDGLYEVPCRLRYKVIKNGDSARIHWSVHMHNSDRIWRTVVTEKAAEVKERAGIAVLFGSAEMTAT